MKKVLLYGFFTFVILCVSSCKEPYDERISTDPSVQLEVFKLLQNLPEDEKAEVNQYIARIRAEQLEKGVVTAKTLTVRQALEEQAKWRASEAEKATRAKEAEERAAKEEEAKKAKALVIQKQMLEICSVDVTKRNFVDSGAGNHFNMELTFTNKGNKDLVFVKGELKLLDKGGRVLKSVKIPYRKTIKAKKSASSRGDFPYNPNSPGDKTLAKIKLTDLKVNWVPLTYTFSDGSTITAEL
jgi:hypothetical protein